MVNIIGYALVVPRACLLSVANGQRRRFRVALVTILLVCLALLAYLSREPSARVGSSGASRLTLQSSWRRHRFSGTSVSPVLIYQMRR